MGSTKGPRETGDLDWTVGLTWYFSPAMSSFTGASAVNGALGFTLVIVLPGGSKKNGSGSYLGKRVEGIGKQCL